MELLKTPQARTSGLANWCALSALRGELWNLVTDNCLQCYVQLFWAQMHGLSTDEVLFAFGRHYRDLDPEGTTHQNIRSIIANGMEGVRFSSPPLSAKQRAGGGLPAWAAADTGTRLHSLIHIDEEQSRSFCLVLNAYPRLRVNDFIRGHVHDCALHAYAHVCEQ